MKYLITFCLILFCIGLQAQTPLWLSSEVEAAAPVGCPTPSWEPTDATSSVLLWLSGFDIDDDGVCNEETNGTTISTWNDRSANNYDATGIYGTTRVAASALNNQSAMHFDYSAMDINYSALMSDMEDSDMTIAVLFERLAATGDAHERIFTCSRTQGTPGDIRNGPFSIHYQASGSADLRAYDRDSPGQRVMMLNSYTLGNNDLELWIIRFDINGTIDFIINGDASVNDISWSTSMLAGLRAVTGQSFNSVSIGIDKARGGADGNIDMEIFEIVMWTGKLTNTELESFVDDYINSIYGTSF